jgi:hypothetical protein
VAGMMIQLTKGYEAIVDDEDFERVNKFKWCALVRPKINYVMAVRSITTGKCPITRQRIRRFVYMHHFILEVDPRVIHPLEVDHINRNSLDNRKNNLRIVTHAENMRNVVVRRDKYGRYTIDC